MNRTVWRSLAAGVLSIGALINPSRADTIVSDQATALVVYPLVTSAPMGRVDTTIQLSNTSPDPVAVRCYYVNALGECSASGEACFENSQCSGTLDLCVPKWVETDFNVYLTARQPFAWLAGHGIQPSDLPLDGVLRVGPDRQHNAGTLIPPFGDGGNGIGELKCYAVNGDGTPSERNVLVGQAVLSERAVLDSAGAAPSLDTIDVASYSAVGFRALAGTNNGDNQLVLGGDAAEYDGCPNVLILNHFFDFAKDPVTGDTVTSTLVLVPCTENFVNQVPTHVSVQYLVFNEFEQRFSTSRPVDCFFASDLSDIDTNSSSRSIFGVFVGGTLTGQTRIRPVNGGIIGVALEKHGTHVAAFNLHVQGEREGGSDIITVVQ